MEFLHYLSLIFCIFPLHAYIRDNWPPEPCDPLCPEFCTLPYPNNYWMQFNYTSTSTSNTYTPMHLVLSTKNFPVDILGQTISPQEWNNLDGFSPIGSINTYFEDIDISSKGSNLAPLWNISQSIGSAVSVSPVILLHPKTLERIPHWVELDYSSDISDIDKETNRTLMIWPAYRLEDGERYIVGLQNLVMNNGESVAVSEGFVSLRDNKSSNSDSINQRRDYYETEIFEPLVKIGIDRENLQLAWDFTVMSTRTQTNRIISMRDDAFSRLRNKEDGNKIEIKYKIDSIEDDYREWCYRKVNGHFVVPWYLNLRYPSVDVRLETDWDDCNTAVYQYDTEIDFEMLIPRSVANGSMEGRILQYGHGLFGDYHEIETSYLQQQSNEYGYVIGGVDWLGMAQQDVPTVTEMISTNSTDFPMIPDRMHQGMLDALIYMKLMLTAAFQNDSQIWTLSNDDTNMMNVNFNKRNYYGNSNGGIMGSVYMALTTDITHGTCGVPGGPYSLLLPRSCDFSPFHDILMGRYLEDVDRIMIISFLGELWTRMEPAGFMHHISRDLFDDTPMHTILIHYGLGDAQVSWMGAKMLGRSINASMFESNVEEGNVTLYGFDFRNDNSKVNTSVGSGNQGRHIIQGWNYNLPLVPFVNRPPDCNYDSHEYTRRQADAIEMNHVFFTQGIQYNGCGGACEGTPTVTQTAQNEWKSSAKYKSLMYMRKKADTFLQKGNN